MDESEIKKRLDVISARATELEDLMTSLSADGYEPEGEENDEFEDLLENVCSLNYQVNAFLENHGYE